MKSRKSWLLRLVGVALTLVLVGTACGGGSEADSDAGAPGDMESTEDSGMNGEGSAAPSIDTGSAKLRQTLTDLLNSHVYLAGIAVEQAVLTEDPKSQQFKSAAGTLDENSQISRQQSSRSTDPRRATPFLKQWREHIGFFVDYTVGGLTNDKQMQQKAGGDLAAYEEDFGAFLSEATGGELEAGAAAEALGMHVDSLVATVDAVIAGDGKGFDLLYAAAKEHMPMTASALAGAIVEQMPDQFAE